MGDDGRLAFGIGIEYSKLIENAEKVKEIFEQIGQVAINEGNHIDDVFKRIGDDYDIDIDVSSIETKLSVLVSVLQQTENEAVNLDKKIGEMGVSAANALRDGDLESYRSLIKQLVQLQKEYTDTTVKITNYRETLKELSLTNGTLQQESRNVPMVFASEEDYSRVKQLKEEIKELQANIAEVQLSDKWDADVLVSMQENLIELNGELNSLEGNAAKTASALGEKMGSKAAEVQSHFYELNAAVKEQKQIFDELNEQLAATEKELAVATQAGDVNKVAALQLKYSYLADQVRNAGDALADLEGQQKDAEGAFDSLQNSIGGVVDAIGNLTSGKASFRTIITSIGQLSGLFKKSGTGLTAFITGLRGMGGAANLAKVSIKGLWATITANPIGAIVAAIAGLIAIIVKLAQSIKTTSDKQLEAAQIEAADLEYTESVAKRKMDAYDEAIRAKQREIDVAKSANKSNAEIYKLEDERYRLQRDKAKWQEGYFGDYIANLDTEYAKLDNLNQQLRAAEDAQISGESKFEITIDGKTNKADIEKQIDILKQMIENTEANIKIGVDAKEAVAVADAEQKKYENEKRQQARQTANVERQALQDAANARIELMGDSYAREVAMAQEASKNRISDLRRRLKEESNLTAAAIKAINENIETEEKALQKRLLELERAHVQEVNDLWREVEELQSSARPQTMSQEGMNLWRKYLQEDANIQRQIEAEENPQKREALVARQNAIYEKYLHDREQLGKEHAERATSIEEQAIQLRLEAAREGSAEELQLSLELIEKQRQAELERNRHLVEEQRQDEATINAKYDKQRENTQKEYYDNLYEQYGSFEQRRQQIAEKYAKERNNLYTKDADGNKSFALGITQSNLEVLKKQEQDAYRQLGLEFSAMLAQNDASYNEWLSRIDSLTISELKKLLAESKKALAALMQRKLTGDIFVDQKEIDKLLAKISELEKLIQDANLTPGQEKMVDWKKAASYVNDLGSAFSDLGDTVGGSMGDVISSLGSTITTVGNTINTVIEGTKKAADAGSEALKTIESASVVLAVISAAVKVLKVIVSIFNGTDEGAERLAESNKRFEDTVHSLTRAYKKLNREIDKAYGTEKAVDIRELIRLKEDEIKATEGNISATRKRYEELKKRKNNYDKMSGIDRWTNNLLGTSTSWTDKQQEEFDRLKKTLKESGENIEDIQNEIADLRQQAIDAIFGSDIQSSIEQFAEAYSKAWINGTDAAEAGRDVVKDIMRNVVTEALKAAIAASGKIDDIRKAVVLAVGSMIGGTTGRSIIAEALGIDEYDAGTIIAQHSAQQYLDTAYGMADELTGISDIFKQVMERLGLQEDVQSNRTAQAAGLQSVSQESFDATSGRITSIQGHTFNMSENSNIVRDFVASINGNVAIIRDYTSHLVRMDNDIRDMKNNVQIIRQGLSSLADQ